VGQQAYSNTNLKIENTMTQANWRIDTKPRAFFMDLISK